VGLYNCKANDGPTAHPFALEFVWAEDRVTIRRANVREIPELDAARSIAARMRDVLGPQGAMDLHAIASALGERVDSVKQAAYRAKRDGRLVNFPGPDGVYSWALKGGE
jgi:hypothetical protein